MAAIRNLSIDFSGIIIYNPNNLADSHTLYSYHQTLTGGVYALAIDETRNKIYWVDNIYSRLNVGSLDGKVMPTTLFDIPNSGTLNCTGLVINTVTNVIYFTDANSNKIYSADLNAGTLPAELVTTSTYSITNPLDLAISTDGNSLYWPDPNNQVNVTDLTTKKSSVLFNDGMISLFVNPHSNDIYMSSSNQVFKSYVGATTLTVVFKDKTIVYPKNIISFVVH